MRQHNYGTKLMQFRNEFSRDDNKIPRLTTSGGRTYKRPFSFKETVEAAVNRFNVTKKSPVKDTKMESFPLLWQLNYATNTHNTSTGIYRAGDDVVIVPVAEELVRLTPSYNEPTVPVTHSAGEGIKVNLSGVRYNQPLTKEEAKQNALLLAALEEDQALLNAYVDMCFFGFQVPNHKGVRDSGMRFNVPIVGQEDIVSLVRGGFDSNSSNFPLSLDKAVSKVDYKSGFFVPRHTGRFALEKNRAVNGEAEKLLGSEAVDEWIAQIPTLSPDTLFHPANYIFAAAVEGRKRRTQQ